MNVVALYKCFRGDEFLLPSIASVYPFVDRIVMVHSDTGWDGSRGATVRQVVETDRRIDAFRDKIVNLTAEADDQDAQYRQGFKFIREMLCASHVLIVDTDEVWEAPDLQRLIAGVAMDGGRCEAYTCRMHTYIKRVNYRITPPEPLMPIVMVRADVPEFRGVRGNGLLPRCDLYDVRFHHYSYVRRTLADVLQKVESSHIGDRLSHVDLDKWVAEKWNKLPDATNFHTTKTVEYFWKGVTQITDSEIPATVKQYVESAILEGRND